MTIFASEVDRPRTAATSMAMATGISSDNYMSPSERRQAGSSACSATPTAMAAWMPSTSVPSRQAFGTNRAAFDFDGGGSVDALDFGQFRPHFGTSI